MSHMNRESRIRLLVAVALGVLLVAVVYLTTSSELSLARSLPEWGWTLRYELLPIEDETELAELHMNAQEGSRGQCVACHGDRTDSELIVHRIHLESELLTNLECNECHPQIDLGPRDNDTTARWVDVGFCKTCHSEFPALQPEMHMQGVDIDADCTMCHTGDREPVHAQPYLPRDIPGSECNGCHGARVLPWTPAHERSNWLQVHGKEALEVGTESCLECHDFGLKFCDECHLETPPSHMPTDRWLAIHANEAQADTRVCYSCHETSHCKKCHVNHEEGWMDSHPGFVKESGDSSCSECHSSSSCSYCHTASEFPEDLTQ